MSTTAPRSLSEYAHARSKPRVPPNTSLLFGHNATALLPHRASYRRNIRLRIGQRAYSDRLLEPKAASASRCAVYAFHESFVIATVHLQVVPHRTPAPGRCPDPGLSLVRATAGLERVRLGKTAFFGGRDCFGMGFARQWRFICGGASLGSGSGGRSNRTAKGDDARAKAWRARSRRISRSATIAAGGCAGLRWRGLAASADVASAWWSCVAINATPSGSSRGVCQGFCRQRGGGNAPIVGDHGIDKFCAGGWVEPGPSLVAWRRVLVLEPAPSGGSRCSPSGAALARAARPRPRRRRAQRGKPCSACYRHGTVNGETRMAL
jgi:hypothetical protein